MELNLSHGIEGNGQGIKNISKLFIKFLLRRDYKMTLIKPAILYCKENFFDI